MAIEIRHRVVIHRSAADIFAAVTDFAAEPRWQPAVLASRHTPPGPVQVGTRTHQVRKFFGRRIEATAEVTAFEPDRLMVCISTPEVSPVVQTTYALEPDDGSTALTFIITLGTPGAMRLFVPIIKRSLTKDVTIRFATLKRQMETR